MVKQVHSCAIVDVVNPAFQLVSCNTSILLMYMHKLSS